MAARGQRGRERMTPKSRLVWTGRAYPSYIQPLHREAPLLAGVLKYVVVVAAVALLIFLSAIVAFE